MIQFCYPHRRLLLCAIVSASSMAFGASEHWAVGTQDLNNAPCRPNRAPRESEILDELHAQASGVPRIRKKIAGQMMEDTPENLTLLENLTKMELSIFELAKKKVDRKEIVLSGRCSTLECVLEDRNVFAPGTGAYTYYLLKKYNLNASPHVYDTSSAWNPEELQSLVVSLSNFPSHFFRSIDNRQLSHFKRGYTLDGGEGRTYANASIQIFDPWSRSDQLTREQVLFHEFGHVMDREFSKNEFWLNDFWVEDPSGKQTELEKIMKMKIYKLKNENAVVSGYAKTNPQEDFAENVLTYRYAPKKLKALNPARYETLKNYVFDGLEFNNSAECAPERSRSQQAAEFLMSRMNDEPIDSAEESPLKTEAFRTCGEKTFTAWMNGDNDLNSVSVAVLKKCLSRGIANRWLNEWPGLDSLADRKEILKLTIEWIPEMQMANDAPENLREQLRNQYADFMDEFLSQHHIKKKYLRYSKKETVCTDYSQYSYQTAEKMGLNKRFSSDNTLFAYRLGKTFDQETLNFCQWLKAKNFDFDLPVEAELVAEYRGKGPVVAASVSH